VAAEVRSEAIVWDAYRRDVESAVSNDSSPIVPPEFQHLWTSPSVSWHPSRSAGAARFTSCRPRFAKSQSR